MLLGEPDYDRLSESTSLRAAEEKEMRAALEHRLMGVRLVSKPYGAWRSLVSALVWGTRGPEFKSRRPDQQKTRSGGFFVASRHPCYALCASKCASAGH
jgi:hypothetical protein